MKNLRVLISEKVLQLSSWSHDLLACIICTAFMTCTVIHDLLDGLYGARGLHALHNYQGVRDLYDLYNHYSVHDLDDLPNHYSVHDLHVLHNSPKVI